MIKKTSNRLLALDILRGITIAGMILVNNPGDWGHIYEPLRHADWNGLTPTDLIFPFFMFIMGISTYISLQKTNFELSKEIVFKIIKRTLVIFAIGLGLAWFGLIFWTYAQLSNEGLPFGERLLKSLTNFSQLRILGVLQRLALCYGATALIAVTVKHKYIVYIILGGLMSYSLILLFGNGYSQDGTSILSIVDTSVLGKNHMWNDSGIDPEGILSTIPSICHVLIGFLCGKVIVSNKEDITRQMLNLFIIGAILSFSGFLFSFGLPINKKIWSPTFVLTTCGLGATFLALLIWIIDVKGYRKWTSYFEAFGVNPLFIYVLSGILAVLMENIRITYSGNLISLKDYLCHDILQPLLGNKFGSFFYALLFVSACWVVARVLYVKKIYIKI